MNNGTHSLLGFTQSGFDPASRFRFIQMIPHFERAGWRVEHRPNRPDRQWHSRMRTRVARGIHYRAGRMTMTANRFRDVLEAGRYDVVFTNRDLAGRGLFLEKLLHRKNPRIVYDFDDAIFVGPNEYSVRWMCEHAAWITPGNPYLADYVKQFTDRFTIVPTVIDTERVVARDYSRKETHGLVRVGWSGSDQSIRTTLVPHLELLQRIQKRLPFELVVITNTKPTLPLPDLCWRFLPWNEKDEHAMESKFDVGLMPLLDDEFQRGKCGLKLLQYMAAALPTVASPVGVNASITQHGVTGYLARTDSEWQEALAALLQDADLRSRMGTAARARCEREYSIRRWAPTLLSIFSRVSQWN